MVPSYKLLLLLSNLARSKSTTNTHTHTHNFLHLITSDSHHRESARMSDIAMLVAEEYERRAKNLRKDGGVGSVGGGGAAVRGKLGMVSSCASMVKEKIGEEKKRLAQWVTEFQVQPKSQIGLAASDSFFSA